jgi:hypothetical protein
MKAHKTASFGRVSSAALAAIAISLVAAATTGCNATGSDNPSLRNDLAAIRTAHGDPDSIGSLDATAPPPNLDTYRRSAGPAYRTVAAHR